MKKKAEKEVLLWLDDIFSDCFGNYQLIFHTILYNFLTISKTETTMKNMSPIILIFVSVYEGMRLKLFAIKYFILVLCIKIHIKIHF